MCGLVGAFGTVDHEEWLDAACRNLRHRGPDHSATWVQPALGIALAHTRLSIQDLSAAGNQPMASSGGRLRIVFNGEIYNHFELRDRLGRTAWRSHSDTETLVECLAAWGPRRTLKAAVGMFAFAAFDEAERRIILARDRFGEKPLYYGLGTRALLFGSQLKAITPCPTATFEVDRHALALFMRYGYVPSPLSIFEGFRKLPAGSWMEVGVDDVEGRALPAPERYWTAEEAVDRARCEPPPSDDIEASELVEEVLLRAIKRQMISDVPLGAFLSGGIDSSTVVALLQANSPQPVRTFSIGFDDWGYDESRQAAAVAGHLGTAHTDLKLDPSEALAVIPRLANIYDEPFGDASQIPTILVSELAREQVTVSLSGDGGDEVFGGYNRHVFAARHWPALERVPQALRRAASTVVGLGSARAWSRLASAVSAVVPAGSQVRTPVEKLEKLAHIMDSEDGEEMYWRLLSQGWDTSVVLGAGAPEARADLPVDLALAHRTMLADTKTYLPDDILVKVDRAAMAISLETRVPFLDPDVFEAAWRLPVHMKIRDGKGKWIVRKVLHRYVPPELVERPKMGFAIPLAAWLRDDLREWGEDLLAPDTLKEQGWFEASAVRRRWEEHQAGRRNWERQLWNVLMFQAWFAEQHR